MRKIVCMLLAVLLALGCTWGTAGEADGSELTSFVLITGEEPVPVFAAAADSEPADTLQPNRICGLLDELTEQGTDWFHILYLDENKEGVTGYIRADQAKRLTTDEFSALLEDPDKANEALDLVEYLRKAGKSGSSSSDGSDSGIQIPENFREFYEAAMKALNAIFSLDITGDLEEVTELTKDAAGKAVDAGLEILDTAANGAGKLIEDVSEEAGQKISEKLPELTGDLDAVLQSVTDTIGSLEDQALSALDSMGDKAGSAVDSAGKKMTETIDSSADKATETIDSIGDKAADIIDSVGDTVKEKIPEAQKTAQDFLDKMDKASVETAQELSDELDRLISEARATLDGTEITTVQMLIDTLPELYEENGFVNGTAQLVQFVNAIIQLKSND